MVILFKYVLTLRRKQQSSSTKHQVENIHFIYGGHYEMCLLFRENRQKNRLVEKPVRNRCEFCAKNRRKFCAKNRREFCAKNRREFCAKNRREFLRRSSQKSSRGDPP